MGLSHRRDDFIDFTDPRVASWAKSAAPDRRSADSSSDGTLTPTQGLAQASASIRLGPTEKEVSQAIIAKHAVWNTYRDGEEVHALDEQTAESVLSVLPSSDQREYVKEFAHTEWGNKCYADGLQPPASQKQQLKVDTPQTESRQKNPTNLAVRKERMEAPLQQHEIPVSNVSIHFLDDSDYFRYSIGLLRYNSKQSIYVLQNASAKNGTGSEVYFSSGQIRLIEVHDDEAFAPGGRLDILYEGSILERVHLGFELVGDRKLFVRKVKEEASLGERYERYRSI